MNSTVELIFSLLDDNTKTLVFTSEIVAVRWIREYVRQRKGKAIFRSRVVSWDQFKLRLINVGEKKRATKTDVLIFANNLLENDEVFSKLKYFSNAKYPEAKRAFAKTIAKYVSFFPYVLEGGEKKSLPEEVRNDIEIIEPAFRKYLNDNGLYDFNYEQKDYSILSKYIVLIFPETFCDEIVPEIIDKGMCSNVSFPDSESVPLHEYRNSIAEIKGVFRKIQSLLENGVSFSDIAVSSSCVDLYRPFMEAEAKARGINLSFTSTTKLMLSAPGLLLKAMERVVKEEYSFDSLSDLLLNPIFPFEERDLCRQIIDIGVEYKVLDGDRFRWEKELKYAIDEKGHRDEIKFPLAKEAGKLFCRLADRIEQVVKGPDAEAIKKNFLNFCDDFLEGEGFEPASREFSAVLKLLDEIGRFTVRAENVFALLMDILETRSIVRKYSGEGIPVYSYPVSAGLPIANHFVMGLSDSNTEMVLDKFPYLDDLDEGKPEPSVSIAGDLRNAYANPMLSKDVWLSGTRNGFDGSRLLPVSLKTVKEPEEIQPDCYSAEKNVWNGKEQSIKALSVQKAQYEEAKNRVLGYSGKIEFLKNSLSDKEVAATNFKYYGSCHYLGFLKILLSAEEKRLEPVMYDPFVVGNILHEAIQNSLEEKKSFSQIDKAVLNKHLKKAVDGQLSQHLIGSFSQANHIMGKYSEILSLIVDAAKKAGIDDAVLVANEKKYEKPLQIDGLDNVRLNGRIDTVLKQGDKYLIIDYKTSGDSDYKTKNKVCDLEKTNPQVALYAEILAENIGNAIVEKGGYYKIKNGEFCFVWEDEDSWKNANVNLTNRIDEFKAAVVNGDYPITAGKDDCDYCAFSRVCRRGFSF